MNKKGPIIIIENNQGDRKLFIEVFSDLHYANQIIYFNEPGTACNYLLRHKIKPFLVFTDIVLLNTLNYKIDSLKTEGAKFKCPYLFFTTFFEQSFIIDPYSMPTQSYFIKPYDYKKFKQVIKMIVEYWLKSKLTSTRNLSQISSNYNQ
jgi:response regulator of citrate/malate metabolism